MSEPSYQTKKIAESQTNNGKRSRDETLAQMPIDIRQEIELCLDVEAPAASNWQHFAEKFNIRKDVIRNWDSRNGKVAAFSASAYMFDHLKAEQPDLTVNDLWEVAMDQKRKDVVRVIDKHYDQMLC
ncbi:uncharacterized protein LOC117113152 [Anneissia japonica]|uniref:uncharacterized protein LOC117113152 n=1 Tax=Anneissia japonica TaxID=1529436 RepID=UPI0014258AFC|nr:uncharacterized protein LOC117113152 [Anneissia japonica]